MNKTTLILLVVLAVVLIGGGVLWWMNPDMFAGLLNKQSNTNGSQNTNTVTGNVNYTPITGEVPEVIEGDTDVTGTFKIGDVTVTLTGMTRTKEFETKKAADGQEFIVVYFMPVESNQVLTVKRGLESDSRLVSGTSTYELGGLKIASALIKGDRGYWLFSVPAGTKNMKLVVGSGNSQQTVNLP